ncbi:hypothetical protein [Flavobacterium suzhouense]|uniref:Uncharacterized protein n=1 Tax=Flavobacterium suzhouense TaxID=1529638 RepID=A0ABW5NNU0_9FLAO
MEPNKMEKDFREKLEQRTIQPSDMAWDRLDAMLSVAENKKPKKNRSWMYIAAAFLVFLLVGVLFLNQEKGNSGIDTNNSIVVNDNEVQNESDSVENEVVIAPVRTEEAVAYQSPRKQSEKVNAEAAKTVIKTEKATQILPQEVIVSNEKQESPIIVRENTDKILADATSAETAKKKSTVKVDPNSLLSAVEEELDDSFKDRVLIGAAKNFKAVRSAVANRNYE